MQAANYCSMRRLPRRRKSLEAAAASGASGPG